MLLRIFIRDRYDFAAQTDFGIVSECFYGNEVGLRFFLSKEKREEKLDLEIILSRKAKGRKEVGLKIFCPSKREKESKVKQFRRGVRSPVRQAGEKIMIKPVSQIIPNNSILPVPATKKKNRLVSSKLAAGASRKIVPVRFSLLELICATRMVFLSRQLFYSFTI